MAKKPRPLTLKQQKFIEAYDGNAIKAARAAGYKGNSVTLQAVAAENLRKPRIAEALQKRATKKLRPLIASREERQRFWSRAMRHKDHALRDRLKAAELLGKSEADFIDKLQVAGAGGGPIVIKKIILPDNGFSAPTEAEKEPKK